MSSPVRETLEAYLAGRSRADAVIALSGLACDLGDVLDALDVNPLICGPSGAVAADVLAVPRPADPDAARMLT